jgi:cytochrome c oxidase subunit IV
MTVADEETARATEPEALVLEPELADHPGPREYVKVAIVLAIATALEVALYYIKDIPHGLFVGLLLFFAAVKFGLVALWFMHLRFDSKVFKQLFVTGIILAAMVYTIVLSAFGTFRLWTLIGIVVGLGVLAGALSVLRRRG